MNNVWLKIKLWTKIVICAFVAVYLLVFIVKNNGYKVDFWFWYNRQVNESVLLLVSAAFLTGVLATILTRMMFHTARQFSVMRNTARTEKLEREVADMKLKAAMLQTRASPQTSTSADAGDEIPLA